MFLKNERSLGVKNGSLGTVQNLTATRMAVMLDDGRLVAFDIKDYAHVDHGYAATIHKAQGVTVDRVHELATPGLDRHAAYVALSRHRDRVDLHYGQDDFADRGRLVRTLGRERGKDMASDHARAFGDRRNIRLVESRATSERRDPQRDPFAGPKLQMISVSGGTAGNPYGNWDHISRVISRSATELPSAVTRHARIVAAMRFAHSVGEPYTAEQRAELTGSRAALNSMRPMLYSTLKRRSRPIRGS